MKKTIPLLLSVLLVFAACNISFDKKIKGSGHVITESRAVTSAHKIRLQGSYDVELVPGTATTLKIEGDDNLLPYIITKEENGWLIVKTKEKISISTSSKLKVYITTDMLEAISLSGAGNIRSTGKFVGGDKLDLNISGVGSADLEVNAPSVNANISGSGSITLSGETKDSKIDISGIGSYKGENLKAENVEIQVSGSGSANVFADNKLDVQVSGIGNVYYKGNATVSQKVSGSGSVKKME